MTYWSVLRDREFCALFTASGLSVLGDQVTRIAVALLVLERSGSPLFASATYATSYLTWLVGGPLLSALPDRYPRRRVMVLCDLARLGLVAALALVALPLWGVFVVLAVVGLLAPPFESARSALLADILDGERYVVGNALNNVVSQLGQVVGFVAGGALVLAIGVDGALLADAATFFASAVLLLALVRGRTVERPRDAAPTSFLHEAVAGARLVAGTPRLRLLLGWGLLSATAVIAPEGLAVAVARENGEGALVAGILTAAVPAGFLVGSYVVLRMPADGRERLFPPLLLLSCVPLAVSGFVESLVLTAVLWTVAGAGNAVQLVANASFVQAVPPALRGRAFGVAGTCLMAVQGLALLVAGALAEVSAPRVPVALLAVACLCCAPLLLRASHKIDSTAQGVAPGRRAGPG